MNGISVVICSFNGSAVIANTLKSIINQIETEFISWEVILIDNASTDNTFEIAQKEWNKNLYFTPFFKAIHEPKKGKINALLRGFKESKYNYILICDDDNLLSNQYISRAFKIMNSNSSIGVLGGKGVAKFEEKKPIWFDEFETYYAVGKQASKSGNISNIRGWVYGAGSVIRKEAILGIENYSFISEKMSSRRISILRGEDIEISYYALKKGFYIWYDDELLFEHYINKSKSNILYLKKLLVASAYNSYILDGLSYKVKANYNWYNLRLKRNWFFRLLIDILKNDKSNSQKYISKYFLIKIKVIKIRRLILLNFKYDKSFYEN